MKIFFSIVLAIIILIAVAIVVAIKFINPDDIKNTIGQQVYEQTKRQLVVNGPVHLSFFPWLGIKINDVALSNTETFKNSNFARVGEVDIQVRLIPLFSHKIEIGKLTLKDLDLVLIKNKAGYNTWDGLLPNYSNASNSAGAGFFAATFFISNVNIRNGNIDWQNKQTKKSIQIKNLNLRSNNVAFGQPFNVEADFKFNSAIPEFAGDLDFHGKITLAALKKYFAFEDLKITGKLSSPTFERPLDFDGGVDILVDLKPQVMNINNLNLRLANLKVSGSAKGINILDAPNFIGKINVATFDPKVLLRTFGYTGNAEFWRDASLKFNFETTSKFLKLPVLEANLGDVTLRGNASYSHFDAKNIFFNIDINKLDFSRFDLDKLPKQSAVSMIVPSAFAASATEKNYLLEALRLVKLNGDLKVGSLKVSNLHLANFSTEIIGNFGLITCAPMSFALYQGKGRGSVVIDERESVPRFIIKTSLSGIALQPFMAELANINSLSGVAALDAAVTLHGKTQNEFVRSLTGTGKVMVTNGVLHGVDLVYEVNRSSAVLNHRPLPEAPKTPKTDFGKLDANFNIVNGILSNNDLLIQAQEFKANGQGTVNLVNQTLDYLLTAQSMHDANFYVPIRITNTFSHPVVRPDIAVLLQHTLKTEVKKQIEQQLEKNKIPKEIINALPLDKILGQKP
ncbi:MAG: AsmA family protein [Gammaproteobacteria bacterium]|nr:AsmA family protein [Gammaproteobacteria bacterium]